MLDFMTINTKTKIEKNYLSFNIPTSISNQQPIFTLDFLMNEYPSVTIKLNPNLQTKNKNETITFIFNEDGICTITKNFPDNYFIKAELVLEPNFGNYPEDNYCKMKINYGKGQNELFYLKGTFNLNDFSN